MPKTQILNFCALSTKTFTSVSRLLPPERIYSPLFVSFIQYLGVDFFPALILRWLGLICMHLHNESHLHAQGRLYHENRHEKVRVRQSACACMPDCAYAVTCWCSCKLHSFLFPFTSPFFLSNRSCSPWCQGKETKRGRSLVRLSSHFESCWRCCSPPLRRPPAPFLPSRDAVRTKPPS